MAVKLAIISILVLLAGCASQIIDRGTCENLFGRTAQMCKQVQY